MKKESCFRIGIGLYPNRGFPQLCQKPQKLHHLVQLYDEEKRMETENLMFRHPLYSLIKNQEIFMFLEEA